MLVMLFANVDVWEYTRMNIYYLHTHREEVKERGREGVIEREWEWGIRSWNFSSIGQPQSVSYIDGKLFIWQMKNKSWHFSPRLVLMCLLFFIRIYPKQSPINLWNAMHAIIDEFIAFHKCTKTTTKKTHSVYFAPLNFRLFFSSRICAYICVCGRAYHCRHIHQDET